MQHKIIPCCWHKIRSHSQTTFKKVVPHKFLLLFTQLNNKRRLNSYTISGELDMREHLRQLSLIWGQFLLFGKKCVLNERRGETGEEKRERWRNERGRETKWKKRNWKSCPGVCRDGSTWTGENKSCLPQAPMSNRGKEAAPVLRVKSRCGDSRSLFSFLIGHSGHGFIFFGIFENAFTYPWIKSLARVITNGNEYSVH